MAFGLAVIGQSLDALGDAQHSTADAQHSTADAWSMGMGMGMHRDHGAERMHGDGCMGWMHGDGCMEHGSHREHGICIGMGTEFSWAWQKNAKKSEMRQAESTPHLRARSVSHRAGAQKIF